MSEAAVVVVGAGINGLSLAFHLARRGAGPVVVLERSQVGAGATGRSGGIVRTHYADEAEIRLALEGLRWFQRWDELVGGGCGFEPVGLIVIAPPERRPQLERSVAWQRSLGIDSRLLSAEEARDVDPALRLPEAVSHVAYEPNAGCAEPNLALRTLAEAALRLGVEIRVGVEAGEVLHAGQRVTGVATSEGVVRAPTVVVAAGAWANRLLVPLGIDLGMRPARARVAVFPTPPGRPWPHPACLDHVRGSWYRPVAGAATLVGVESAVDRYARPDDTSEGVDGDFLATCAHAVTERFPVMRGAPSRGAWAGMFMESPDQRPVIGPLPPYEGLYAIAGDSGTSFKTAPAIGLGLSELILTGESRAVDLEPFRADRLAGGAGRRQELGYAARPGTVSR
ncbi:MAG TPA: FAD-binding oxidoreductase [Candidatus Dormibacteraeota bacterium]|nr:FAD-binding oxidoreductase [Candidatus Dormibacteraeota bacterium]